MGGQRWQVPLQREHGPKPPSNAAWMNGWFCRDRSGASALILALGRRQHEN